VTATTVSETRQFTERAQASTRLQARIMRTITRRTGITPSGLILVGVIVVAWLLGRFIAGRPLYLLAYGGLTVLAISWGIGRRPLPLEGVRAGARARRREGETISMSVSLTATRRLNTFILEEHVPSSLGQNASIPVASLEAGDSVEHSYQLTCWRRGVYELGPLIVRWGDPFGFTERQAVLCEPFEFLVHPSTETGADRPFTRLWEDPPVRPPVSKPWPSGMEFYGMRTYSPGDDIRRIVWRAYARTGQLLVREAEQGVTDQVIILLDDHRANHSTGMFSESFETGIRAAASLAEWHLKEGFSVTLEANGQRIVGPVRGPGARMEILDALARLELGDTPVTDGISRMVHNRGRDSHVVVISPLLEREGTSTLELLIEKGWSVLIVALLWDELAAETLAVAARLGCQVAEVRPNVPLAVAFRNVVGGGVKAG
jgi:uncharacterized protein (DUF58 family)